MIKNTKAPSTGKKASEMGRIHDNDKSEEKDTEFVNENIMIVATWNMQALYKRDLKIENELREQNIDICNLLETKKIGKG